MVDVGRITAGIEGDISALKTNLVQGKSAAMQAAREIEGRPSPMQSAAQILLRKSGCFRVWTAFARRATALEGVVINATCVPAGLASRSSTSWTATWPEGS
ncbi:MAG: hypothetical protein QG575_525 [Euryarchaeota archaeon]|nr:hypothetical protein [Euryarchaeota archaeon]